jgi:glutathione S-transferase
MSVVRVLYHFPLDPASRQARLAMGEKRLPFHEVVVRYWEAPRDFAALNPSGLTPVLLERTGERKIVVCEIRAILEHLEREVPDPDLLGPNPADRAEVRRLLQWFDRKFDTEVNACLLYEKLEKRLQRLGAPDLNAIGEGRDALRFHLTYMEGLLEARDWLVGRSLSLADFSAAAHISVIDYFGDVPWREFPLVKTWYMRIKSRPAFRPILADRWPGLPPSGAYDNLDF